MQRMNDDQSDATPTGVTPIGEDARIKSLDTRLNAALEREESKSPPAETEASEASYSAGNRVLADLLGGIVGGLCLGWVIDQFAGTRPWGLLVMLFFGIFVAFRNIIRRSGPSGAGQGGG